MNVDLLHHLYTNARAFMLLIACASGVAGCSGDAGEDVYADEAASEVVDASGSLAGTESTAYDMPDELGPETEALGVARQALTQSFRASCRNVSGIITETFQDFTAQCRRQNGRFVNAAFVGSCRADIANCNGFLRCGPC